MCVYKKTEKKLWTVGYYNPDGTWEAESDHDSEGKAAKRVHWLNGGWVKGKEKDDEDSR